MKERLSSLDKLHKHDPMVRVRFDGQLGVIRNLRGHLAQTEKREVESRKSAGIEFLHAHPDLFGNISTKNMEIINDSADPLGGQSITLQQYHESLRVYAGSVRFHFTKEGVLDTISNRLFPDLKHVPCEPAIEADEAVRIVMEKFSIANKPEREPELLVYRHQSQVHLAWEVRIIDDKPSENGLAWPPVPDCSKVEVRAKQHTVQQGPPAHWIAYVDAINAELFFYYDNVQSGAAIGNGTGYYSGAGTINTWFTGTTYQLRDVTRTAAGGAEIITNDEDGAAPSEDADNNWDDLSTSPRDQNQGAEVDAHRYAADAIDYFQLVHTRNSYDGMGHNLTIVVHYLFEFGDGYWVGGQVRLGDGDNVRWDYCTTDDWLAHEVTHAYTEHTCALQYAGEAGALNEAFSDIFAAYITGDWLVFEESWLNTASAPAYRNMMDPTNGGKWNPTDPINSWRNGHQPSHYSDLFTGGTDGQFTHINNGIINNLFYLLTVGGTHTISGISVTGIGQSAAERMLFRCMSVNLVGQPTANFLDFRQEMLDACQELFPTDLFKLTQVKNAFNAVGIGPDLYVRDNLADSGEEPYPGTYLWASPDIINRTAMSANPAVDFADLTNDSLWQNVEFGQDNYVYVRLQNRGSANGDATVNVYFSAAATFGTPASWIHIGTLTELDIIPGSLRIAGPLTFPEALIPAPGHYCMIAVVTDALDPAPDHTLIASLSDYLYFVRNTNNIAYRNMDVVNEITAGAGGSFAVEVRSLGGRERFDLYIDYDNFVPGTRFRVRGPARILDGAFGRGLKLVEREENESVYELLGGRDLIKHRQFIQDHKRPCKMPPGFYDVIVDDNFELKLEYTLPENILKSLRHRRKSDQYEFVVRQAWQGEVVGAAGIRLILPEKIDIE